MRSELQVVALLSIQRNPADFFPDEYFGWTLVRRTSLLRWVVEESVEMSKGPAPPGGSAFVFLKCLVY